MEVLVMNAPDYLMGFGQITEPFKTISLSQPRDPTQVSHIAGRFFTSWATRETQEYWSG